MYTLEVLTSATYAETGPASGLQVRFGKHSCTTGNKFSRPDDDFEWSLRRSSISHIVTLIALARTSGVYLRAYRKMYVCVHDGTA